MSSVDVIVPCYRYGHFLTECVQSVLTQSGPSVRALIIDDASPDNTAEVATELMRSDSRVLFHRHTSNRGHIATYNEGIDWATSDYMLLLSADDYLLPGALSRAVMLMDRNPEVGFTFGNALQLDTAGVITPITSVRGATEWRIWTGKRFIKAAGGGNIVPSPTSVIRLCLQRQVGGYRSELPHSGDMEMWLRLAAHSSVGLIKAYQAVYRRHTSNMSLAYMDDSFLGDLGQRKAALDCFFRSCSSALPGAHRLQRRSYRLLGRTTLGLASQAFDENKLSLCQKLSTFALQTCPTIRRSLSWVKLSYRRFIGYETWHAWQLALDSVRMMASRLNDATKL